MIRTLIIEKEEQAAFTLDEIQEALKNDWDKEVIFTSAEYLGYNSKSEVYKITITARQVEFSIREKKINTEENNG